MPTLAHCHSALVLHARDDAYDGPIYWLGHWSFVYLVARPQDWTEIQPSWSVSWLDA